MKLSDFGFNLATIKLVTLTSASRNIRSELAEAAIDGKIVIVNCETINGRTRADLETFLEGAMQKRGDFIKVDEGVFLLVPKTVKVEYDDKHMEDVEYNTEEEF